MSRHWKDIFSPFWVFLNPSSVTMGICSYVVPRPLTRWIPGNCRWVRKGLRASIFPPTSSTQEFCVEAIRLDWYRSDLKKLSIWSLSWFSGFLEWWSRGRPLLKNSRIKIAPSATAMFMAITVTEKEHWGSATSVEDVEITGQASQQP